MEDSIVDQDMLRSLRASYASALKDFAESSSSFRLVRTIPFTKSPATTAKSLYVLDSSFNPPTNAHRCIAISAFLNDPGAAPKRILLLLATQNADKANKPASMEDRLVMMTLFAHELLYDVQRQGPPPLIDIGLVKRPYFHEKAAAVDASGVYPGPPQQVHLVGFDTLIRIFNTKYYPPDHNLRVLAPFLSRHRLRATYRTDDKWGSRESQDQYIQDITDGRRKDEGAAPEWTQRISLVQGIQGGDGVVSSTMARNAADNDPAQLDKYVLPTIREWIVSERLYLEQS